MLTDSGMGKCPLSCGAAPRGTASRARLATGSGAVPAACNSAVRQMAPDELMAWLLGVGSGSPSRTARPCCPHPQPGVSAGSRGLARTVMEWVAPGPARSPGLWAAPGKGPPGRMTPTSPTYQGSGWDGAEAAGRGIPLTLKKGRGLLCKLLQGTGTRGSWWGARARGLAGSGGQLPNVLHNDHSGHCSAGLLPLMN